MKKKIRKRKAWPAISTSTFRSSVASVHWTSDLIGWRQTMTRHHHPITLRFLLVRAKYVAKPGKRVLACTTSLKAPTFNFPKNSFLVFLVVFQIFLWLALILLLQTADSSLKWQSRFSLFVWKWKRGLLIYMNADMHVQKMRPTRNLW